LTAADWLAVWWLCNILIGLMACWLVGFFAVFYFSAAKLSYELCAGSLVSGC
jgi:hypothetical protein